MMLLAVRRELQSFLRKYRFLWQIHLYMLMIRHENSRRITVIFQNRDFIFCDHRIPPPIIRRTNTGLMDSSYHGSGRNVTKKETVFTVSFVVTLRTSRS